MLRRVRFVVLVICVFLSIIYFCGSNSIAGDLLSRVDLLPNGTTHRIFTNGNVNVDDYPIVYSFFYARPTEESEQPKKSAQSRASTGSVSIPQIVSASPVRSSRQMSLPLSGTIESLIDGEFEGWQGETIVKLMNGQIWQQTEYYYYYHYSYMPKVLIYLSGGGYKMKVDGIEKAIGVTQLR